MANIINKVEVLDKRKIKESENWPWVNVTVTSKGTYYGKLNHNTEEAALEKANIWKNEIKSVADRKPRTTHVRYHHRFGKTIIKLEEILNSTVIQLQLKPKNNLK